MRKDKLEAQLGNLVHEHADWLTAQDLVDAAIHVARAHFPDDLDEHKTTEDFAAAIRRGFEEREPPRA